MCLNIQLLLNLSATVTKNDDTGQVLKLYILPVLLELFVYCCYYGDKSLRQKITQKYISTHGGKIYHHDILNLMN